MTLKLISGIVLSSAFLISAFYSWYLVLSGKFKTAFIMPVHENDPPQKGRKWFILQSFALLFAGLIVAMRTWQSLENYSDNVINNLYYAVSAFLLLRAVGEFKHMGLFRTVKEGDFAHNDHRVLTPMAYLMFLFSLVLL